MCLPLPPTSRRAPPLISSAATNRTKGAQTARRGLTRSSLGFAHRWSQDGRAAAKGCRTRSRLREAPWATPHHAPLARCPRSRAPRRSACHDRVLSVRWQRCVPALLSPPRDPQRAHALGSRLHLAQERALLPGPRSCEVTSRKCLLNAIKYYFYLEGESERKCVCEGEEEEEEEEGLLTSNE